MYMLVFFLHPILNDIFTRLWSQNKSEPKYNVQLLTVPNFQIVLYSETKPKMFVQSYGAKMNCTTVISDFIFVEFLKMIL